ncbi:MAG: hypothetical protein EOO45_00125 [Flavobacterium sp.]|nr:MAG: hypothetical protein EOO45_00125 [Flavobacterium sp.]
MGRSVNAVTGTELNHKEYQLLKGTEMNRGIEVRYMYSACVVTTTPDVSVLHDPWFTEGAYDGSWYHFPEVKDPIAKIGDVDLIFISHIHPDHYDPKFIKDYFGVYGKKDVLIANHLPNHLSKKMSADGIDHKILTKPISIGSTEIEIVPHKNDNPSDVDSAIVIKYKEVNRQHCVVNANDIIFDEEITNAIKRVAGEPDILLCGYTGAGPYPQTYFELNDPLLELESNKKKNSFFQRYEKVTGNINAKVNIPFAGKYILGGKFTKMNAYRGVADATEVLKFDPRAVVLADMGGAISTLDLVPTEVRISPYSEELIASRIDSITNKKMTYETLIDKTKISELPIKRLLRTAASRAAKYSGCNEDFYFVINLPNNEQAIINTNSKESSNIVFQTTKEKNLPSPRSELQIDATYLFGLLVGLYHWNNAEVGSQFMTRRHPNIYNQSAQQFLNFLSVC